MKKIFIIIIAILIIFLVPSEQETIIQKTVPVGGTVNQLILDSAKESGININSVNLNDSRDKTIYENGLAGELLKPGKEVKVIIIHRD